MNWQTCAVMTVAVAIAAGSAHGAEPAFRANVLQTACYGEVAGAAGCCACGNDCDCCPSCEFTAGYLYMAREYGRNSPLVSAASSGDTLIGMSDFEGDFESGFEVSGRWSRLEARYLQISSDAQDLAAASFGNQVTFQGDDYFSDIAVAYDTDLHSGEINLYCTDPCAVVRVKSGFRYLQLNEGIAGSFPGFTGVLFTETRNELYGLQLGVDADLWARPCSCFSLVATSKAGVYFADTRLDSFPNAAGAVTLGSTADSSERGAFVGELGLLARVRVMDCLTVDAGYNLMLITGVALAGDQSQAIDMQPFQPATSSIQNGEVLYHGLTARATLSF
ncbi:hypothetical protein KOR34_33390 [Posidoniimonas corsicana]|uniref:Uncharacterized protein n=1 Tax=Posidoniimonas corsicana TaxID=1938618 RepID=A0A5C5V6T4_9BACT|nr:hypothetical protein [Posidoniimonas corsicana]TWT33507.1 hypothetical protein KOR34_33390 [Posidoniimonas corsicana]